MAQVIHLYTDRRPVAGLQDPRQIVVIRHFPRAGAKTQGFDHLFRNALRPQVVVGHGGVLHRVVKETDCHLQVVGAHQADGEGVQYVRLPVQVLLPLVGAKGYFKYVLQVQSRFHDVESL